MCTTNLILPLKMDYILLHVLRLYSDRAQGDCTATRFPSFRAGSVKATSRLPYGCNLKSLSSCRKNKLGSKGPEIERLTVDAQAYLLHSFILQESFIVGSAVFDSGIVNLSSGKNRHIPVINPTVNTFHVCYFYDFNFLKLIVAYEPIIKRSYTIVPSKSQCPVVSEFMSQEWV